MEDAPHRKLVKHFNVPGHAHLLTFSCYQRRPLFDDDERRILFSEGLNRTLEKQNFQLVAFVFMPEHLHLLVWPREENYAIDALLFALKRPFSFRIKKLLEATNNPLLKELTIRDRTNHTSFRFWQEGPGFDNNIHTTEKCILAAEYIHNNPVRRGMSAGPGEYRWSSWKYFHRPEEYARDTALPVVGGFPG